MSERPQVRMPFGKFRDLLITDLADGYLSWLHDTPPFQLREWLATAIHEEYESRGLTPQAPPEDTIVRLPFRETRVVAEVFEVGFRTLMKREHPDSGGCVVKAQQLNALRDLFVAQLKGQRQGGAQ